MEGSKKNRPRIVNPITLPIISETPQYVQNCCSDNAKKINTISEKIDIEFWIDIHYTKRAIENGGERENIGIEFVEPLVAKSIKHLLYYSLKHKSFVFINHPPRTKNVRNIRVTLKQNFKNELTLNIVAEFNYISTNSYEITIVTAMRKDDFYWSVGEYAVEFDGHESVLLLRDGKTVRQIDNYTI